MIELVTRVMIDSGFERKKAVLITGGGGFLFGLPSALSIDFLNNQDWVWGLGLLLNGFLFTLVVWKFGVSRFRMEVVHTGPAGGKKRAWLDYLFLIVLPLEFFVMMGWWFWKAITVYDPHGWWNPFHTYSLGTCLFQWGVVLLLLLVINRYWLKKSRQ
jgi:NSS family neurotransmitter:Na+ symporter